MNEKFLYVVSPRMPIRNEIPGTIITRESIHQLTIDEVKKCLKYGPVYRKFANTNDTIQVTIDNIDRLHQRDYVDELEEQESPLIPAEPTINFTDAPHNITTPSGDEIDMFTEETTEVVDEETTAEQESKDEETETEEFETTEVVDEETTVEQESEEEETETEEELETTEENNISTNNRNNNYNRNKNRNKK